MKSIEAIPGMRGEFFEVTRSDRTAPILKTSTPWGNRGELYAPGFSHLNVYITARLY